MGLNDFRFSVSLNPSPDILLIGRTINANNIVDLEGPTGASAFAVAGSNLGATGPVTVSGAPLGPSTPGKVTVCETHSHTGACLHPPAFEVGLDWSGGTNRTFAFFIEGLGRPSLTVSLSSPHTPARCGTPMSEYAGTSPQRQERALLVQQIGFSSLFAEGGDTPMKQAVAFVLAVASGQADALSGCYVGVDDDLAALVAQAERSSARPVLSYACA